MGKPSVPLLTPFAEPRVGKVWVEKLEGNLRSRRNCRHIYSLWARKAAVTQPCCILWWLTQQTQPKCSCKGFSGELIQAHRTKVALWPSKYILMHMHSATDDLSYYITMWCHGLQNVGWEAVGQEHQATAILTNCSFLHSIPSGSFASQYMHSPSSMIVPWWVDADPWIHIP